LLRYNVLGDIKKTYKNKSN